MQALPLALGAGAAGGNLAIASTLIGGVTKFLGARYQSNVLKRQAAIDEENARRTREAGQRSAQDRDFEAAHLFGREAARQGASGFELGSQSFQRKAARDRFLATRDRMRIVEDAELRSDELYERAAGSRSAASAARSQGIFSLIGTGINLYEDMISNASLVNEINAQRIGRKARDIR